MYRYQDLGEQSSGSVNKQKLPYVNVYIYFRFISASMNKNKYFTKLET